MTHSLGKGAFCAVLAVQAVAMLAIADSESATVLTSVWKLGLTTTCAALAGMLLGWIGHVLHHLPRSVRLPAIGYPALLIADVATAIADCDPVPWIVGTVIAGWLAISLSVRS